MTKNKFEVGGEQFSTRPVEEGDEKAIGKFVAVMATTRGREWVPVGKTYADWLAGVHAAAKDKSVYVLGKGTLVELDDGSVYVTGLLGTMRVGTRTADGVAPATILGDDAWPSRFDGKKDIIDPRVVVAYCDDPDETTRGPNGEALSLHPDEDY